jgi:hypothetical protein
MILQALCHPTYPNSVCSPYYENTGVIIELVIRLLIVYILLLVAYITIDVGKPAM